ncbi:MAG: hypothetical protein V4750_20140 [Pseudomonadota bacterium]
MLLAAPLPLPLMLASLAIVFGAGIVRGFTGFGYSALSVAGLALLVAAGLIRSGFNLALAPSAGARLGVGMASGFVNGFTDLYALACSALVSIASSGEAAPTALLGVDTVHWALWLAPAMLAGIWFGQRSNRRRVAGAVSPPCAEPADADRRDQRAARGGRVVRSLT